MSIESPQQRLIRKRITSLGFTNAGTAIGTGWYRKNPVVAVVATTPPSTNTAPSTAVGKW